MLPAGIAPGDVTLVKAPAGWKFSTASDGFTIAGKALKVGQDAEFAVRLAQLPTGADTLSFKTLETYGDGEIARWIDLPAPGQAEPDHPAPTITLKGAVKAAPSSVATSLQTAPSSVATSLQTSPAGVAASVSTVPAAEDQAAPGSSRTGLWITLATLVVIALGGLALWRRRAGQAR